MSAAAPPSSSQAEGQLPGLRPAPAPERLRVCFVAPNAYGALARSASRHSGGIERQTALWARWFAARGHQVTLVCWDVGQAEGERVEGVRVAKMCRREAGLPGLRFLHPRWTSLLAALRRADAEVYHYMNGDSGLGQVALWCGLRGRLLSYYVSSTWAADPALPHLRARRERVLYRFGLRRADCVLVQTRLQQDLLRQGLSVASQVVPMPGEQLRDGEPAEAHSRAPGVPPRVLWVGRVSPEKRLEWLLEVAQACPELAFDVVGAANDDSPYASSLLGRARAAANVVLHGRVSDNAALVALYRRAALLCCTSSSEGFPNTFLEAWSQGLPLVTTFDPDGLAERRNLGRVARDVPGLVAAIRSLLASSEAYRRAAQGALEYFEENHRPDVVLPRVERLLVEAVSRRRGKAPCSP